MAFAVVLAMLVFCASSGGQAQAQTDPRLFSETNFAVQNDQIWDFFAGHGAVSTFGYPVSRTFTLDGCPVQVFQRLIAQICAGQGPAVLNLLDPELFPYTSVNGSVFPGPDQILKDAAPRVGTPEYAGILDFVLTSAPDDFQSEPVDFGSTFLATGGLEIWGLPISQPTRDPSNASFIYQRFQRGIMHYSAGQGTRGLLLADYFKAVILGPEVAGDSLPGDLAAEASGSAYYAQYCPDRQFWLCRPADLPGTDLTGAFQPGTAPVIDVNGVSATSVPTQAASAATSTPTPTFGATIAPSATLFATAPPTPLPTETPAPIVAPTPTATLFVRSPPTVPPSPTLFVAAPATVPPTPTLFVAGPPTVPPTPTLFVTPPPTSTPKPAATLFVTPVPTRRP